MMLMKYDNFRFYRVVFTKKRLNSVYAKVSYLSAGILCDKSTCSPVISLKSKNE